MEYKNWLNNACANRLYYAMFQAGTAVLNKSGLLPPESKLGHNWVQSNFSGKLIHRGKVFPAKFRSYLSDAYWVRVVADYRSEFVGKKTASRELKKAKDFVNTINSEFSHASQS